MEYTPPVISAVSILATGASTTLSLSGGDVVALFGLNFGPVAAGPTTPNGNTPLPTPILVVTYGPAGAEHMYTATTCTVVVAHTTVQCTTAPGVGSNLVWHAALNAKVGACDQDALVAVRVSRRVAAERCGAGAGGLCV